MAVQELRRRYAGTFAGILWSVVHPLSIILVYWFVFEVAFQNPTIDQYPFILVFLCGMIPWLLFSETIQTSTAAIVGNVHLVKRAGFPTEILPIVYLLAAFIPHVFLLLILFGFLLVYDIALGWWALSVIYGAGCVLVYSLGISWVTSALNVFFKDVGQFVTILINIWFWLTPIVWSLKSLPEPVADILRLNPLLHVVNVYRGAFLYQQPPWSDAIAMIAFWASAVIMFLLGGFIFRRLKPEFADVI